MSYIIQATNETSELFFVALLQFSPRPLWTANKDHAYILSDYTCAEALRKELAIMHDGEVRLVEVPGPTHT